MEITLEYAIQKEARLGQLACVSNGDANYHMSLCNFLRELVHLRSVTEANPKMDSGSWYRALTRYGTAGGRAYGALHRFLGASTAEQVSRYTDRQILAVETIGVGALEIIKKALIEFALTTKEENDDGKAMPKTLSRKRVYPARSSS